MASNHWQATQICIQFKPTDGAESANQATSKNNYSDAFLQLPLQGSVLKYQNSVYLILPR